MYIVIAVAGYFLGNISTGLFVGKYMANIDIRQHGSGNAGMTNVLRTMGWLPSVLTLVGDVLKGVIAGLVGRWLGGETGAMIGGLAAIAGHNWPALFGFKGGRGIATSLGAIIVVNPLIALALVLIQAAVVVLTRYMSVASLVSAVAYFALTFIMRFGDFAEIAFAFIVMVLAVYSHRENIARLKNGNENRLDFSKIKFNYIKK
jgi:glycerol-3-phosphate acyltransferase PlsY